MNKTCVSAASGLLAAILLVSNAAAADKYWDPNMSFHLKKDVLTRLNTSGEVKSKIDAVFAAYQDRIDDCEQAIIDNNTEIIGLGFGGLEPGETEEQRDAKLHEAEATRDEELYPALNAVVAERTARVREVLPLQLKPQFDRAMKLFAEWDAKRKVVVDKYERDEEVTDEDKAYNDELKQKLDAEVGLKK